MAGYGMNRFFAALTVFLSVLPAAAAHGKEPRLSLRCEWIRLPHTTANQLIREHLRESRNADALYTAAERLIREKQAARLDIQALVLPEIGEVETRSGIRVRYPSDYTPPHTGESLTVSGADLDCMPIIPPAASAFRHRDTGRRLHVATSPDDDTEQQVIDFDVSWTEQTGDLAVGFGVSEIRQPLFFETRLQSKMAVVPGIWQLAGLLTPPPTVEKNRPAETAPASPDRVLLFMRTTSAAAPPAHAPAAADESRPWQTTLLVEWIETSLEEAAALLADTPDFSSAGPLRAALRLSLEKGSATLLETALLPCAGNGRTTFRAEREIPCGGTFNAPQLPSTLSLIAPAPPAFPPGERPFPPWVVPAFASSLHSVRTGLQLETDCAAGERPPGTSLNLAAELSIFLGWQSMGFGPALTLHPREQRLSGGSSTLLQPTVPALLRVQDAPAASGPAPGATPSRKVFLIVTAIP